MEQHLKISMKTRLVRAVCALCFLGAAATASQAQRQVINLSHNWTFQFAQDQVMRYKPLEVTIPHTFNADETYQGPNYARNTALYEHKLADTLAWQNKRVFLRFEGVNSQATVLVNGKTAGQHAGGYTAFCLEITELLKPAKNTVQVLASNAYSTDVLPLSGDFNVHGGIHRPVSLLLTDKDCISPLHYATSGVYIKTPQVSATQATIEVATQLSLSQAADLSLLLEVKDAAGKLVGRAEQPVQGKATPFTLTIPQPRLWNGKADPHLYSAQVTLLRKGQPVDKVTETFGLRYFKVDTAQGFFLNGKYLDLHGVCRHEDVARRGSALLPEDHIRDMELTKEIGATSMRLTHYPHSKPFYHLADENGLVLWTEIPLVGPGGYPGPGYLNTPGLHQHAQQIFKEMIYQHFNHPSVFFWGLFNELKMDYDDPRPLVDTLQQLAKQIDPDRLTTLASFLADSLFQQSSDLIAWNKYYGWYGGKTEQLGTWLDGFHKAYPNKPVAISEYGAGASIYHQSEVLEPSVPNARWHPEGWQTQFHIGNWRELQKRPFVWGKYIWVLADFGSSIRTEGDTTGMNDKGLVTYDRKVKKDAFFFYKANWNEAPMLHIANKRLTTRKSATADITAFSNLAEVELVVNGRSVGKLKPDVIKTCAWPNVALQKGKNEIIAKGKAAGREIVDRYEVTVE